MEEKKPKIESHKDIDKAVENDEKRPGISRALVKNVAANGVNVILLIATFYFLGDLPHVAQRIKDLRSAQIAAQETVDAEIIRADITRNSDKIEELESLFVGDTGFSEFASLMSALQTEGVVLEFSFPGGSKTNARQGHDALQFSIVFQGPQEQVNNALRRVLAPPILIEPSIVELEVNPESLTMRLNAYLLVNGDFAAH